MGYKEGEGMSIEDGLLLQRKLKYGGIKRGDAYKVMGVSPFVAEMMMRGQVLCGRADDVLKKFIEKSLIEKFKKKTKA